MNMCAQPVGVFRGRHLFGATRVHVRICMAVGGVDARRVKRALVLVVVGGVRCVGVGGWGRRRPWHVHVASVMRWRVASDSGLPAHVMCMPARRQQRALVQRFSRSVATSG